MYLSHHITPERYPYLYRYLHAPRLDERWVTMNGARVLLSDDGEVLGGLGGKYTGQNVGSVGKGSVEKQYTPEQQKKISNTQKNIDKTKKDINREETNISRQERWMQEESDKFSQQVKANTSEGKMWGGMGSALEDHDRMMAAFKAQRDSSVRQLDYLRGKLSQQENRLSRLQV